MSPPEHSYDVAIVGGGLVGASLACALAPLGLRLLLVEAVAPRAASQPSYDDRTLALSQSSCRILEALGIWPELAGEATPIRQIHVRELNKPGEVTLDPAELGLDRFGHVVEARSFGAAVLKRLPDLQNLSWACPARLQSMDIGQDQVELKLRDESGDEINCRARLVVGADGADSAVRHAAGLEADTHDYQQTAIICNVSPELPHRGQAWEIFTPSGPTALLPHRDNRCGLVWCVPSDQADGLMSLEDAAFLQQAMAHVGGGTGPVLGAWQKIGRRSSYALRRVTALCDWRPRVLVLGNAAHAIHPIGAQGFNLGLRDVAVLAELLADRQQSAAGFDPGDAALLRRYSNWRAPDHQATVAYTDGLARLFANSGALATLARGAGLLAHALSPTLRRRLAIEAMGYRGRIPRLAQGVPLAGT